MQLRFSRILLQIDSKVVVDVLQNDMSIAIVR